MNAHLDWVEKAAIENMKAHHVCADNLAKDSSTTLTVLLAGIGGGLAVAAKGTETLTGTWNSVQNASWLTVGATGFTVYLIFVAWYLVARVMKIEALDQVYNEPDNLQPNDTLSDPDFEHLRRRELAGLQIRITKAAQINEIRAKRLNFARMLAIWSPAVFLIFALAWLVLSAYLQV